MAQQQPPQFEFNPGAAQGPFSGMLTGQQPTMGQGQQPTGWTTKTGSVLNVVTNFLSGMEKGRVKNYERQEQQQAKERGVVMDYINMKLRDPNLTDEGRAALEKQAMQFMAKSVLGETEGKGKKKDQPEGIMGHVAGAFHDIALGMVGGQMPKKGDKQDPAQIMAGVDDLTKQPQFSKAAAIESAQKQINGILQQVPLGADQQVVMRAVQPSLATLQKYMDPASFANYKDSVLGGYQAPIAPGANPQHQFINLVPPEGDKRPPISARVGPDGKLYGLDQKEIPGSTLQGYTMQVPSAARQDQVMEQTWDPAQKKYVWTPRREAAGKEAPGPALVPTEGPSGKPVLTQRAEAAGKTAAPPAARPPVQEDVVKEARGAFTRIQAERTKNQSQIEQWYSNALKVVQSHNAQTIAQAGLPTNADDAWVKAERKRRYDEESRQFNESVKVVNDTYFPGGNRNETPPESRGEGAAGGMPPVDTGWNDDMINRARAH